MVAEGNEKYAVNFTVLSKVIVTFGVLWLISYLAVRWLVILNGGGRDMYGIWLFLPDRIMEIIVISLVLVISGIVLYFMGIRTIRTDGLE